MNQILLSPSLTVYKGQINSSLISIFNRISGVVSLLSIIIISFSIFSFGEINFFLFYSSFFIFFIRYFFYFIFIYILFLFLYHFFFGLIIVCRKNYSFLINNRSVLKEYPNNINVLFLIYTPLFGIINFCLLQFFPSIGVGIQDVIINYEFDEEFCSRIRVEYELWLKGNKYLAITFWDFYEAVNVNLGYNLLKNGSFNTHLLEADRSFYARGCIYLNFLQNFNTYIDVFTISSQFFIVEEFHNGEFFCPLGLHGDGYFYEEFDDFPFMMDYPFDFFDRWSNILK